MAIGHRPPRMSACIGTREVLGTYCDDPELRRVPEAHRRRRGPNDGDLTVTALRPRPQKSSDSQSYTKGPVTHQDDAVRTGLSELGRRR